MLKQWEIYYKSVINVRQKYTAAEYRLPKEFNAEVPGAALYQKYKESFNLIASDKPANVAPSNVQETEKESPILTGVN